MILTPSARSEQDIEAIEALWSRHKLLVELRKYGKYDHGNRQLVLLCLIIDNNVKNDMQLMKRDR